MDDMKKAIYMLALKKISTGEEKWICIALGTAFAEITGSFNVSFDIVEELLPEFYGLYDGRLWYRHGNPVYVLRIPGSRIGTSWWEFDWPEPRVRILNYILCKH